MRCVCTVRVCMYSCRAPHTATHTILYIFILYHSIYIYIQCLFLVLTYILDSRRTGDIFRVHFDTILQMDIVSQWCVNVFGLVFTHSSSYWFCVDLKLGIFHWTHTPPFSPVYNSIFYCWGVLCSLTGFYIFP